jgi:hypothetical protein
MVFIALSMQITCCFCLSSPMIVAGKANQLSKSRGFAQTLGPALEPVGPLVDLGHRRQAVFRLGGTEQAKRYRHTG